MSTEQLAPIIAVGDFLRANPHSWDGLTPEQQATLKTGLMPDGPFLPVQRELLSRWWLPVDEADLEALNAACPPDTQLTGRAQTGGQLYVCADLLSDALDGKRLAGCLSLLQSKTLTYFLSEEWPQEESEP